MCSPRMSYDSVKAISHPVPLPLPVFSGRSPAAGSQITSRNQRSAGHSAGFWPPSGCFSPSTGSSLAEADDPGTHPLKAERDPPPSCPDVCPVASVTRPAQERSMALHLPSPPVNGFHIGPAFIHFYGLMYVIGITAAILITQRRWKAHGGIPRWWRRSAVGVPAGIIGGRIYFDITTPKYIPHHWYGVFAVWDGGLGIWGAVALAAVVGAWRVRRRGADVAQFMDAVAPALLVAQAIGRVGNYFNQDCSAARPACPGACRSPRRCGPRAMPATPPSSPHSCMSWSLTSRWPRPWSGSATTATSSPQACSPSTSPATRVPDLRGITAGRPLRALPGPAPEHVRRLRAHPGRYRVVHPHPAQAYPGHPEAAPDTRPAVISGP